MVDDVAYKPLEKFKPIYTGGTLTPPVFMPSYYEWLASKGTQVIESSAVAGAGGSTLYTVPKDHLLYITATYISGFIMNVAGGAAATWGVTLTLRTKHLLRLRLGRGDNSVAPTTGYPAPTSSYSVSYPIPLRIDAGYQVRIIGATDCYVAAGFVGFIVPIKDLLTF